MDISVIFATCNRDEILNRTLDSYLNLSTTGIQWECIIVDNACREQTKTLVESYSDRLPIIYLQEPRPGKNNALLKGLPYVKSSLVLFSDDDVIVDPGLLEAYLEGAARWPDMDIFGGTIKPCFPEGYEIDPRIDLSHGFTKSALVVADRSDCDQPVGVGKIWGPNMAVRRRVFESGITLSTDVGPNQKEKYYIMGSETSFLVEAEKMGFRAVYLPQPKVYHQIRPEQLTMRWFLERAIRQGRGKALLEKDKANFKKLFGVPCFIYPKILKFSLRIIFFKISRQHVNFFDSVVQFGISVGMLRQYWKG